MRGAKLKNILKILFLFFSIFIKFFTVSYAVDNVINSVDINSNIQDNGNINIIETWKGEFYLGTELYHFYENLLVSDISDFSVLENNKKFDVIENWNIAESKDDKKYKASINQNEDGIELVWGVGEKGYHEYKLKYTLNGVFQNNELKLDIFNFNDPYPNNINLKITGNFNKNIFYKIFPNDENIVFEKNEIKYNKTDLNSNVKIFLNFDGINNSIERQNIIKIKSNDKTKIFIILKKLLIIIMFAIIFIFCVLAIFKFKNKKYEFKAF